MLARGAGVEARLNPVPWWVRVVLLIAAAQALLLLAALVDPVQVKLLVPWPASPLNARFIAALYVSLGAGVAAAAFARTLVAVRIALGGVGGLVLLLAPDAARSLWPWAITEPQAQIYSAFFLTLSATGVLAFRETRWEGVRIVVAMVVLLSLLVMVVSAIHLPRFTRPGATATWFTVFAVEALAFGALFVTRTLRRT